ncbi:MAG: PKD domain-containing protein [Bacteroidota bacterium]
MGRVKIEVSNKNILVILALLAHPLLFAQNINLNFPQDSAVFQSSSILFEWNAEVDGQFELEISSDSLFGNLIYSNTTNSRFDEVVLVNGSYYWRVKQNSPLIDSSQTRFLSILEVESLDNLFFHFDADSGLVLDNSHVMTWADQSPNSFDLSQSNATRQPLLIENSPKLNGHNGIYFDGLNDFLANNTFDLDQPCNYFLIFNEKELSGNYLDGSNGIAKHLLRHQSGGYGFFAGGGSIVSSTLVDTSLYVVVNIELENGESSLYINGEFESSGSTGTNSSGGLTIAAFGSGGGNMEMTTPEVIGFESTLTDSIRSVINSYLMDKYAPPIELGLDIYAQNFCDIVLKPANCYNSITWSDGTSEDSLFVTSPGVYYATAIDIFGRISSDTIYVEPLMVPELNTEFICLNDQITWDTELNSSEFDFLWSDSSFDSLLVIDAQGEYYVEITDMLGCTFQSDTLNIALDSFEIEASLGPDLDLCSGNAISLQNGAEQASSYTWNDDSDEEELIVSTSGTYWVEVENVNGCIAQDTIEVNIIGQAPTASFIAANFCIGEVVEFTDLSFPPSGESIDSWSWDFGDTNSSDDQNPSNTYGSAGTYTVTLSVQTPVGCSDSFESEIQINPLPEVSFSSSNLCSDQDAFFDDSSIISDGFINGWSWNFGDNQSASGQNVGHTYQDPGTYLVTLVASSAVNCIDSTSANIVINPSPVSSFNASSTCLGQATAFSQNIDTTIAGPVQNYMWDFGNGFTSNFPITSQTYFVPGPYEVSLSVTSLLGCIDDTIQIVNINDLPEVGFSNVVACIDEATQFTDTTVIFLNDSIVAWNWNFANQGASDEENPMFTFNSTGNFNVSLQVESTAGCEGEAQSIVSVFEDPNPDYNFEPGIGLPPLAVEFENLTIDATNYVWNFGNGDESIEISPEYTYLDSGIFTITLTAFNENGCSESLEQTILVIDPIFELELNELACSIEEGRLLVQAFISNFGNHDINTFDISLEVGNGARLIEKWEGLLRPSESILYEFVARPEYSDVLNQAFFCSEVSKPNGNNRELSLENNRLCKAIDQSEFVLYPPYPNPNQGDLFINYVLPGDQTINIDIIDDRGRIVLSRVTEADQGHNFYHLNIPNLEVGSYVLRLTNNTQSEYQWFFVE